MNALPQLDWGPGIGQGRRSAAEGRISRQAGGAYFKRMDSFMDGSPTSMKARENAGGSNRPGLARLGLSLLCGTMLAGMPAAALAQDAAPAAPVQPAEATATQNDVIRS